jgi:DNA-binding NarL/FixJ family response regulator
MVGGSQVSQSLRLPKDLVRVLIVTPDNMTSEMLKNAFTHGRSGGFTVETLTGSSQKVMGELGAHKAQVALISEELQDGPQAGFKVLQKLWASHRMPSVMLLRCCDPEFVVNAFREGARGVFYRTHSLKALSKCIRTVHQGQIWASNEDLEHILNALSHLKPLQFNNPEGMPLLTRREEDVVRLVADGLTNREIAKSLKVKEHSIRNYLSRIFDKLGVSTRVELVLYAFSQRDRSE